MKPLMAAGIGLMGCIGLLMGCAEVVVPGAMAGAGSPLLPVKKSTLLILTTVIFTFMLKRACRIKYTGAGKTFSGLRVSVSDFSKRILAMI